MERQSSVCYNGIDTDTPINERLSARYTKTYAYYTIKDRLPVILTKVLDHLARDKEQIIEEYGKEAENDIKGIIGQISKLKNEVQTNKSFVKIESDAEDIDDWNKYLILQQGIDEQPSWFQTRWLYAECYMYRRLWEMFETSKTLRKFDPFAKQKKDSFKIALNELHVVSKIVIASLDAVEASKVDIEQKFIELLKMSLWGNRCDLSITNGVLLTEEQNVLSNVKQLDSYLLIDNSKKVFELLNVNSGKVIDFVHDNAAYELFTDFCFCDFLCTSSLASKIRLHVKNLPWFVSDACKHDVEWLLDEMNETGLTELCRRWRKYFRDGVWILHDEKYWTLPFDYNEMEEKDPSLYKSLSQSTLVIFKGDLNYRKLLGDVNFDHTEKFEIALRGFKPTNVLSLRTVKCDLVCGLKSGQSDEMTEKDPMWMRTGDYGLIQFYEHKND